VATDYIRQRVQELGPGTVVIAETRVDPEPLLCRKDLGGTVDVQIINGDFGELIGCEAGGFGQNHGGESGNKTQSPGRGKSQLQRTAPNSEALLKLRR
jgi:hypothetical protein